MADSVRSQYIILGAILAAIVIGLLLIFWPDRASDLGSSTDLGTRREIALVPNGPRDLFDLETGTSTLETEATPLADYDVAFRRTIKPDPAEVVANVAIEEDQAVVESVSASGLADIGPAGKKCSQAAYQTTPVTLFDATELLTFEPQTIICVKTRHGQTARLTFGESANEFSWKLE